MATRFYITSSAVPAVPITPAASSSWQESAALVRRRAIRFRDLSAATSVTSTSTATSPETHATVQAISEPLDVQTITGTLTGQIRCLESASAGTGAVAVGIRVVSQDGTTVRGTLLSVTGAALDYATSLTNRSLAGASSSTPITLGSVTTQRGDRLLIELGTKDTDTSTSRTYSINIGCPTAATDLAVDQTTTTANNPWVEFSQTLTFQGLLGQAIYPDGVDQMDAGDIIASGVLPSTRAT